jgi:hypothetical protein
MHYHVNGLTKMCIQLSLTDSFLKVYELQDKFSELLPISVRIPEAENCLKRGELFCILSRLLIKLTCRPSCGYWLHKCQSTIVKLEIQTGMNYDSSSFGTGRWSPYSYILFGTDTNEQFLHITTPTQMKSNPYRLVVVI